MSYMDTIRTEWNNIYKDITQNSPAFQRIQNAQITIEHYKGLLRQVFHHARENPQIQTLATVYFRGQQRDMIKMFYKHALSEIGHDYLALKDLEALGENVALIPYERPLPATTALLGYAFYQIQLLNPIGYLGYLFHLEFMPTTYGNEYLSVLTQIGVPREALNFVQEHATVDVGHNKMMEKYVDALVTNKEDMETVIYSCWVTAKLYTNMIQEAFESVDKNIFAGYSPIELQNESHASLFNKAFNRKSELSLSATPVIQLKKTKSDKTPTPSDDGEDASDEQKLF